MRVPALASGWTQGLNEREAGPRARGTQLTSVQVRMRIRILTSVDEETAGLGQRLVGQEVYERAER